MLIVDDILFSPIKGINWIFKQIHDLAKDELAGEGDRIRDSLTELYMMLETGQITEEEFDQQEKELLDRLDNLEESDDVIEDGEDKDEEDGDEDEDDEEDGDGDEDEEEGEDDEEENEDEVDSIRPDNILENRRDEE